MRLIDADKLEKEMNELCCGECECCALEKCPAHNQPTAYNVEKVVKQVNSIGKSYCDSVKCDKNCGDCEHGCLMRAITEKVKAGGIDG